MCGNISVNQQLAYSHAPSPPMETLPGEADSGDAAPVSQGKAQLKKDETRNGATLKSFHQRDETRAQVTEAHLRLTVAQVRASE